MKFSTKKHFFGGFQNYAQSTVIENGVFGSWPNISYVVQS